MAKLKRKNEEFNRLEYQINISFDSRDKIYVARVPELQNCHSHGKTPEEALNNAKEAIELWIETAQEEGIEIPLPSDLKDYSGKFVLRTGSDLHAQLAKEALQVNKSLNDLVLDLISKGLKKFTKKS